MNIKKIKPLFTSVVVTAQVYPVDFKERGLISPKAGKLKEHQKVIAVGESARGITPGQTVCIDLKNYAEYKYKKGSVKADMEELTNQIIGYHVPQIELDHQQCLYLDMRDIRYIIEDFEDEEPKEPVLVIPDKSIIL